MAGDLKLKYGTAAALTVTNLHSIASSSTWSAGWTSAWIDNTSALALDYLVGGEFKVNNGAAPTTGTEIRVYAYASYDGTVSPDIFSSGTEGTEGTATVHDTEQLDAGLVFLWSTAVDTTTGDVYSMPPRSIARAFGNVPRKFALFVAHNTGQNLHSAGNALYYDPILNQYT